MNAPAENGAGAVPRRSPFFAILAALVLFLAGVPLFTSVFVLGFGHGDSPCVLCWAQRTSMALVALIGLFVLRYGPRPRYLGLAVVVAAHGLFMGVRHSALHWARDVGQGFSVELIGAHTYSWSAFVFWCIVVAMGVLLMLLRAGDVRDAAAGSPPRALTLVDRIAGGVFLLVAAGNIVQAFASTGPPPFMGQADPIRFSFNPAHWVWSLEEYSPAPISWRGRYDIPKPDLGGLRSSAAEGPLSGIEALEPRQRLQVGAALGAPITGLAFDAESRRFLVTTPRGVAILDETLARIDRRVTIDTAFAVDLDQFAGAAFLARDMVLAVSRNKSFVILREPVPGDAPDAGRNFRFFLDNFDAFHEVSRSRFATIRAKMMYVEATAFDPASASLFTVSVPNRRSRNLVVSRFAGDDMTLSEEFVPAIAAGSGLSLAAPERSLAEFTVTGLSAADGVLYALSAAHSTLLVIDPVSRQIVSAHALAVPPRPTGLAVVDDALYVVNGEGEVRVFGRPAQSREPGARSPEPGDPEARSEPGADIP